MFEDFMPRGSCGPWTQGLRDFYIWGNILIATAYIAIPFALYVSLRGRARRQLRTSRHVTYAFITFILLCGGGHLLDGVGSFYYPYYRLFAVWHFVTGLASWYTALLLPGVIRRELEQSNN